MPGTTPQPDLHGAAATPPQVVSKGLKITTIIFTSLAAIGLLTTLILLLLTATNSANEEFGWYFGFSVTASIVNVIPAVVALILGIVGRRAKSPVPLAAIVLGAIVLLVLVLQFVFLLAG
jgi:hypothetical protein